MVFDDTRDLIEALASPIGNHGNGNLGHGNSNHGNMVGHQHGNPSTRQRSFSQQHESVRAHHQGTPHWCLFHIHVYYLYTLYCYILLAPFPDNCCYTHLRFCGFGWCV